MHLFWSGSVPRLCIYHSFHLHNSPWRSIWLLSAFYRWENQGTERPSNFPKFRRQMVENLGFKPRQSASRPKFLSPPLCCLNNGRPKNRTQLFWLCTSSSGPVPCRQFHHSLFMKRALQLGSSPLALTHYSTCCIRAQGFPGGSDSKESSWNVGRPGFDTWVGKISWRREW